LVRIKKSLVPCSSPSDSLGHAFVHLFISLTSFSSSPPPKFYLRFWRSPMIILLYYLVAVVRLLLPRNCWGSQAFKIVCLPRACVAACPDQLRRCGPIAMRLPLLSHPTLRRSPCQYFLVFLYYSHFFLRLKLGIVWGYRFRECLLPRPVVLPSGFFSTLFFSSCSNFCRSVRLLSGLHILKISFPCACVSRSRFCSYFSP